MARSTSAVKLVLCNVFKRVPMEWMEESINGREMLGLAKKKIVFAKRKHCQLALTQEEDILPRRWRKFYLVFPEIWKHSARGVNQVHTIHFVDCIQWTGQGWRLAQHNIDSIFHPHTRVVGLKKR